MKRMVTLSAFLLFALLTQAQIRYLQAVLSGANETPPNASTASGVVIVKYNTATNNLILIGDYMGLSAPAVGSHIHEASPGVPGPIIVPLTNSGGTAGTVNGSATLTDAQEAALLAGTMYVNVHSATFPAGEIRGQLMPTTEGQTDFLNARMQGAQEVLPNPSTATGSTFVLLDKGSHTVYVTGRYAGLNADVSGSHIHMAPPGATGPIIIPFTNSGGTSGVMHTVMSGLTSAMEAALSAGGTYANVHSAGTYAPGEIRGQVTNLSQLMFFAASLTGAEQVPPVSTPAKGTVLVRYNPDTYQLDLVGDYQGLSAPAIASHIHQAPAGVNGPVIIPLANTGGTDGVLTGSATITEAQEADLFAGNLYVNVHNSNHPGGEIRGQLMPTTVGKTQVLVGKLQGSQETPPNSSGGTGLVAALLDVATGKVFVTASFSGLSSNAVASHIHQAPALSPGGIILPLSVTKGMAGTVTGTGTLTPVQVNAMVNGFTYLNIHSELMPAGELRAQLGNLVLQEPDLMTYYRDWDKDGFGDPAHTVMAILPPAGYVSNNLDCNDYRVYYEDKDNDGWGSAVKVPCGWITRTGDCDDNNNRVHSPQTFYRDMDGDSWGDAGNTIVVCSSVPPAGYVANRMDCNDHDKMIRYCPPAATTLALKGRDGLEEQAAALTLFVSPNPVAHTTRIQYRVPVDAQVSIKVFDVLGREVNTVFQGQRSAGTYTQEYNASKLSSGVYYLRLVASAGGQEIVAQGQKLVKAE